MQRSKIEELELLQRKLIGTEALPGTEASLVRELISLNSSFENVCMDAAQRL